MPKGGRREGSGRKKNEESRKYKILAFVTPKEVKELIAWAKKNDKRWLLDQVFGKAPQRMEIGGPDGGKLILQITHEAARKYDLDGKS